MRIVSLLALPVIFISCLQEDSEALDPKNYDRWEFITERDGLANDEVWSILSDDEGSIWFGTSNGLTRYELERDDFDTFGSNVLVSSFVNDVIQVSSGDIWVGTDGGLSIFNGNSWQSFSQIGGVNWGINSLVAADNDFIWVGTYTLGVIILTSDGLLQFFDDECPDCNFIWRVFQDSNGRIWIGSDADIKVFDQQANLLAQFDSQNIFGSRAATTFYEDSEGSLWIGFIEGNTLIKISGDEFEIIDLNTQIDSWVTGITEFRGDMWFTTFPNGVLVNDGILTQTIYDGPESVELTGIRVIGEDLWVTSFDGVARYIP